MKPVLLSLFLLCVLNLVAAEPLQVEAFVDKNRVGLQENFRFTLQFTGEEASQIRTPEISKITAFRNLGSSSSESSRISLINGKMERSFTKTFTYTLQPIKAGNFIIPPITITHKNLNLTTSPIRITVSEADKTVVPPSRQPAQPDEDQPVSARLEDNLFIMAEINKSTVYENEPIKVDYKLFSRYDILNLSFAGEPAFNGFWKEDIFTANAIRFNREIYQGVQYKTMLIRSVALFPTTTGKLEIPALEMLVDIRVQPTSFFDFNSTRRYTISSKVRNINVRELPLTGRPESFTGAVGSYTLVSNVSSANLKVGDSFTYTLEIAGVGNLNQFDPPRLAEITNLRFIDPEVVTEINENKISGKKTMKYLVIAQEKGEYTIPAIAFSFFDTSQKRYVTTRSKSYTITVEEGDKTYLPLSAAQSLIQKEGSDIGFIVTATSLKSYHLLFQSFYYWLLVILIFLTIPVTVIYSREREKLSADTVYFRERQAEKILRRYMKQATEQARKGNYGFYTSVTNGLSNFLADKLGLNRGSETEKILYEIRRRNLPEELIKKVEYLFAICNQVRFMPGGTDNIDISSDLAKVKSVFVELARTHLRG